MAHVPVGRKENEIVSAPRLLKGLNLRGRIISGDAMFAQRDLSTQVVEDGGDYCWIAKENQPTLFDDLKLLFSPIEIPVAKGFSPTPRRLLAVVRGHGQIENGLHHRRDGTVQEDASQMRMVQAPRLLASPHPRIPASSHPRVLVPSSRP